MLAKGSNHLSLAVFDNHTDAGLPVMLGYCPIHIYLVKSRGKGLPASGDWSFNREISGSSFDEVLHNTFCYLPDQHRRKVGFVVDDLIPTIPDSPG